MTPPAGGTALVARRGRRQVAVAVAVGVLAGGGVWWLRRPGPHRAAPAPGAATGSAAPAALQGGGAPVLPAPALTGIVVDARGEPIVGARLAVWPTGDDDAALPQATPSAVPGTASATVTGTDGRFALVGLPPGAYRVRLEGDALFAQELAGLRAPADDLRLVAARHVEIAGTVASSGRVIGGATVALRAEELGATLETTADEQGRFAFDGLPEATYAVWAWRDDVGARAVRVPRLGAGPFAPIALNLEPSAVVVGHVLELGTSRGVPAAIELRPVPAKGAAADDDDGGEPARYVRTDASGVFRVEGIPHGRWIIDGYSPGYVAVGAVEFEAGRGVLSLELAPGAVVEGRVTDVQGAPIAGAQVSGWQLADGRTVASASALRGERNEAIDRDQLRRFSGASIASAPAPGRAASAGWAADPLFEPRGELGVLRGPIPLPPIDGAVPAPTASGGATPRIDAPVGARVVWREVPLVPDIAPLVGAVAPPIWRTGADGVFRITGLPRGLAVVTAVADGFAPAASDPVRVDLGRTSAEVEVELSPGTRVVGRVTDGSGAIVAGAFVTLTPAFPGTPSTAMTGADGSFALGPTTGDALLRASAIGFGEAVRQVTLSSLPAGLGSAALGDPPASITVDLVLATADARVLGEVVDVGGLPVRGARVVVVDGAAAGRSALVGDGGFAIERLPAGPLRVRVEHAAYPPLEASLEATADGRSGAAARLVLRAGGGLAGVLLDRHTGAPLGGVALRLTGPGDAALDLASAADGTFTQGALVAGTWTLAVDSPGYVPATLAIEVPAADRPGTITRPDVRFALERGALLAGMVRDRRGARQAGVTVEARTGDGRVSSGKTDADGLFRLRDVPTGALTVRATRGDASGSIDVEVRPGDERLALTIDLDR